MVHICEELSMKVIQHNHYIRIPVNFKVKKDIKINNIITGMLLVIALHH